MWIRIQGEPGVAPASPELLKAHLRIDFDDEDALHEVYLGAAVEHAETVCRRPVLPGTYELVLDAFPRDGKTIELPCPPEAVVQVVSVRYVGSDGEPVLLDEDSYVAMADVDPVIVFPAGLCWPAGAVRPASLRIRYIAEYTEARPLPQGIRRFLLAHVGAQNLEREEAPPAALDRILTPHRLVRFG